MKYQKSKNQNDGTSTLDKPWKKYTVMLRCPDYIDSDRPVYAMIVTASTPQHAVDIGRTALCEDLDIAGHGGYATAADLQDFACIAVYKGRRINVKPDEA